MIGENGEETDATVLVSREFEELIGTQDLSCKRLCDLPDAILLHVLDFLPTRAALQTNVLSKRWRHLSRSISNLVFGEESIFENSRFFKFVEGALAFRDLSPLKVFSLSFYVAVEDQSRVNTWIDSAIRRKVQELRLRLRVQTHPPLEYTLPCCIFRCETMVEFHIGCLHNFRVPSLVCLPNLKVLTLDDVGFGDSLEKLLSLPSLEEVSLKACRFHEIKVLNIGAPNLLKFFMTDFPKDFSRRGQVRIHGARIKSLHYFGPYDRNLNISCPSSLVEAVIVAFQAQEQPDQYANHVFKLLKELSNIEHLTLYLDRLQVMDERKDLLDSCPVFLSLTQLKWYISPMYLGLSVLQIMLSQCPCLRSLVFVFYEGLIKNSRMDSWTLDPVPRCFLSSLKEIRICYFTAVDTELLAVRVFLGAAEVLEKLFIHCSRGYMKKFRGLMKRLMKLPRASNQCSISVDFREKCSACSSKGLFR
ncbi:F-box/FBD/LRR-repeat protein At2g26030-like [Rhodamnia argentea]|uniref:F-box/FBD/LRR-repeat protein At2g26030-like n=1 Tax=Rhodamnia argentea TaxID=178133 RepID=A0ABM3H105_9MYRT|nr:F-box/FBD/LRR-repeat protein At2g26030-like [Rhodamnia argentea]